MSERAATDPTRALTLLFAARSNAEIADILRAHPVLLEPQTAVFVEENTRQVSVPAHREHVERLLWILRYCREKGVEAWLAEVQPLADLLHHLDARPADLNKAAAEESHEDTATTATLASQMVAAYRGKDYPYAAAQESEIKARREDYYLVQLTRRSTTEEDWAQAARKIELLQRTSARKYITELAGLHPDDTVIPKVGFEFVKRSIPGAFVLHTEIDDSIAIGIDPGLQSLVSVLFHAANVAVYQGIEPTFIDLIADLVQLHYLGVPVDGVEERLLGLDAMTGLFDKTWADWSGYVAQRFLLGHEVGHIHLGHLRDKNPRRVRTAETEGGITAFDHQTEFDADAWSAAVLIKTANAVAEAIAVRTMPAVFMSIMGMIEDLYVPVDPVGKALHDTHPPARDWAQRLSEVARRRFHQ